MFWFDDTERHVRPGVALAWGVSLLLLGLAGFWGFFREVELQIRPPIPMEEAREHLDAWVYVTGVRFDCTQVFRFSSSDGKYETTYVVASSEDGSIAALARYKGHGDCMALPAGPVRGKFGPLEGSGYLVQMRRQGVSIPETAGPTLELEMRLEDENPWAMLLFSVVMFVAGMRALRSGLQRRRQPRISKRKLGTGTHFLTPRQRG